jgi:hypothetical protein
LFLALLSVLLLTDSYRCCFVPGNPTVAQVTDVAAFPSNVVVFLLWCFHIFLAVPAVIGVPAVFGFPAVLASLLLLAFLLLLVYLQLLVILLLLSTALAAVLKNLTF